jgi:Tfp pilus assembly protein PilF
MITVSAVAADSNFPGAATAQPGTTLNITATQQPQASATAPKSEERNVGARLGSLVSNLFSSNDQPETAPQPAVSAEMAATHTAIAAHDITVLGEPDSSPALYAARQEIEPAPVVAQQAAQPIEQPVIAQPAAQQPIIQAAQEPVAPLVSAPNTTIEAAAPITAPAPVNTPQVVAAPVTVAENTADLVDGPDDSPARFNQRRELEPVKDGNKITGMLTSLMKPITGDTETTIQDGQVVETTPLAAYESPGIVIKKESFKQQNFQPELTEREMRLAAMSPASGNTSDGGPLIQLPDVPPPVVPSQADKLVPKPKITAPVAETNEPRRELSPASKSVLNKIPSNLDTPAKKDNTPISVNHAKTPETPSGNVSSNSVKHEEMGIKIEVNSPKMDMNYELEKAYNAVTAGNTQGAMTIYKGILQNDPKNKGALFGLGTLYHRAGQIDAARQLYSTLLSIDPNNRDALNNFLVLMADEAPEAALEQLGRLEKRDPKFSPIPAQMAIIYQKMGDMDKASEKMFRAVDLSPENLVYRYNLAIMLDKQQKYDEAGKLYQQILQAYQRGESVPGNIQQIQQRLIFISSAKP